VYRKLPGSRIMSLKEPLGHGLLYGGHGAGRQAPPYIAFVLTPKKNLKEINRIKENLSLDFIF